MKTSVIEVHDMLSVLSVDGVEERIGKVPGVESVTVNYRVRSRICARLDGYSSDPCVQDSRRRCGRVTVEAGLHVCSRSGEE